jgi:hypothetical protein
MPKKLEDLYTDGENSIQGDKEDQISSNNVEVEILAVKIDSFKQKSIWTET